jgi:chemotaxis protein methyltransferase CheR
MNKALMERFVKLIAQNTGLLIRRQDWNALHKKLLLRSNALKLHSLEEYYQLLERDSYGNLDFVSSWTKLNDRNHHPTLGIVENIEWKNLIKLLTTGESYFFRDSGQFFLLKNIILPQLIAEQRQLWEKKQQDKPTLRIWSAGCSTGEEPYSLAILLTELIPDWKNWHLYILGTDINIDAIQKAQAGLYGNWSFRTVDEQKKTSYFHLEKSGWKIEEEIKNLVTFETGNLVQDKFPDYSRNILNMDLIICRNVFVYFDPQAITQVLQKFYQTLKPGGYLVTAHAELYGQDMGLFSSKVFPQSVIYQKPKKTNSETDNLTSNIEPSDERSNQSANNLISSQINPFHGEEYHNSRMKHHVIKPINYMTNHPPLPESTPLSSWQKVSGKSEHFSLQTETDQSDKDLSIHVNIQELNGLLENHRYPEVIQVAKQMIVLQPKNSELYYILAKSLQI